MGFYVYCLIRKVGVLNLERKARKATVVLRIEVVKQGNVIYDSHTLESNPRSIVRPLFNTKDVRDPDPFCFCFGNHRQWVCTVSHDGFPF